MIIFKDAKILYFDRHFVLFIRKGLFSRENK